MARQAQRFHSFSSGRTVLPSRGPASSWAVLGLLLALLGSEVVAQLGPASYRSLEDAAHNSEVILLGRILAIEGEREQFGQATYKVRLEVEEVIKGGDREHGSFYLFA